MIRHQENLKVIRATIEEDLSRRDFTVNAMAQQVLEDGKLGELIDPYNGQEDLQKQIIRTPLDPIVTFRDDPLRMLRAARFAAKLEFDVSETTIDANVIRT